MKWISAKWCGCCLMVLGGLWITTARGEAQVVEGDNGWLFLAQELRHLDAGPFWGDAAQRVSQATREDARDPTPAIVAFHQALAEKGITLLLVPVPPKALMMSEEVPEDKVSDEWGSALDTYYALLREQGVQVVDLRDRFREESPGRPYYCREDSHWSGAGCVAGAEVVAEAILPLIPQGASGYAVNWKDLEIQGDLRVMMGGENRERIALREVTENGAIASTTADTSPVLVLGDSHTLVFHDGGDMHTQGAGFVDQLAYALGQPVDLIGVRGSGATPARVSLFRKAQRIPGYWAGKKVVVWCFAAREFTESDGWRVLPIER